MHRVYGVRVAAPRVLPAARAAGRADIVIHEHHSRRPSLTPPNAQGYSYTALEHGAIHVSWSERFDFVVSRDGARIDVYFEPHGSAEPVYTYLISQVLSVALLRKNIESLHASAVALDDRAIVLVGDSSYGKSTLTAALLRAGARLITDDLLVLQENTSDGYDVAPGAFRLKLEPGTAQQLGMDLAGVPMADQSGKHVYFLEPSMCVSENLPLDRILLLQPHASSVRRENVTVLDATRALLAATFNPLHSEPARLARLMRDAEKIARSTQVERLHVPHDLSVMDQVVEVVVSQAWQI